MSEREPVDDPRDAKIVWLQGQLDQAMILLTEARRLLEVATELNRRLTALQGGGVFYELPPYVAPYVQKHPKGGDSVEQTKKP